MNTITFILMMALSNPYPDKDNQGKLCQQFLLRTVDNKYAITVESYDSSDLKYYTDTLPVLFGDTIRLLSDKFIFIQQEGLDNFLKVFYDNDSGRYETLRMILLQYPFTKPCEYWDVDDDDDDDHLDIGMILYSKYNGCFAVNCYLNRTKYLNQG